MRINQKKKAVKINDTNFRIVKNKKEKNNKIIRYVDLFAGTGAFSTVLNQYKKYKCVFANDYYSPSKEIYDTNHKDIQLTLKDLHDVDVKNIPSHELLCGGFSCQPFSVAGKKKGFDDERANVFWKILEILKYHNTDVVILENVKNLKSHDNGRTFKIIIDNLKKLGYYIKEEILDTCKITHLPQHRERIYIICFKDKKKYEQFDFNFSKVSNKKISDFLEKNIDDKYYYTERFKVFKTIEKGITKDIYTNTLYQFRRHFVRENKSGCCPTLTANMGSGGHNVPLLKDKNGIRKLTPRECFNLQGFDNKYILPKMSDSKLYYMAGNAVSLPVVDLIVKRINKLI